MSRRQTPAEPVRSRFGPPPCEQESTRCRTPATARNSISIAESGRRRCTRFYFCAGSLASSPCLYRSRRSGTNRPWGTLPRNTFANTMGARTAIRNWPGFRAHIFLSNIDLPLSADCGAGANARSAPDKALRSGWSFCILEERARSFGLTADSQEVP